MCKITVFIHGQYVQVKVCKKSCMQALYSVGLRKFLLAGVGPLGCIPNQLATGQAPPGRCVDYVNQILGSFNEGLKSLVHIMNNGSHPGAIFVYGNTYAAIGDILNNPARYGNVNTPLQLLISI